MGGITTDVSTELQRIYQYTELMSNMMGIRKNFRAMVMKRFLDIFLVSIL